jgi:hypothetical protein
MNIYAWKGKSNWYGKMGIVLNMVNYGLKP